VNNSRCRPTACTFSLFAILCALWGALPLHAQNGGVVARAAGVTGLAVLTSGGSAPLLLTTGYILSPGDRIDTRGGGRVVIDLSDGSMVVVAPESVVVLKDYRMAGSLRELFEITLGAVRVKINHFAGKPNPYRMNSPTASIAVRGTEFTVTVAAAGDTEVDVVEGLVEVSERSDPSRSVLLEAGRSVMVPQGQSLRLLGANPVPQGNRDGNDRDGLQKPQGAGNQNQAQANQPPPNQGQPNQGQPNQGPPNQGPPPNQAAANSPKAPGRDADAHPMASAPVSVAKNDGGDQNDHSPRSTASTYDRYLAGLADIGQVPFLLRFNAFSEAHLDSLENPAYAGQFQQAEGRLLFLPTFRGTRTLQEYQSAFGPGGSLPGGYSVSPEFSYFTPAAGFTFGGAASYSRIGDNSAPTASMSPLDGDHDGHSSFQTSSSSGTNYFSGALVAARRIGANSLGLELASLRGSGGTSTYAGPEFLRSSSDDNQTRMTAGFSRSLTPTTTLGVFYRYAFINANDHDTAHLFDGRAAGLNSTYTSGHSSEVGIRLRGMISPRLYYGATAAWLGVSLGDSLGRINAVPSHSRDRAQRGSVALGLGYSVSERTVLAFDVAGGVGRTSAARNEDATLALLQNGLDRSYFASFHAAVQHDLSRRVFLSASLMQVWQSHHSNVDLFPDAYGNRTLVQDSFFSVSGGLPYASRFSDYGAGWRFSRELYVQYVFSTDYGVTSPTHTLMLRWTFHPQGR